MILCLNSPYIINYIGKSMDRLMVICDVNQNHQYLKTSTICTIYILIWIHHIKLSWQDDHMDIGVEGPQRPTNPSDHKSRDKLVHDMHANVARDKLLILSLCMSRFLLMLAYSVLSALVKPWRWRHPHRSHMN